ncbi:hypothetical protein SY88_23830 [Clostridiales bacterium PH28_bin88]|nr:hypothetical protein SY88_23830 [Clostridiales bacterium PH28_bin88]
MNEIVFSPGIIEAVERGREKLRVDQEQKESERRKHQQKNEKKWLEYYQQAQSQLPEAVRVFLSRDDQQALAPSHFTNVRWLLDIWGFAPIFVDFDLNNRPEYIIAELDEIIDGNLIWRQIGGRSNYTSDLDIALAMAFERYQEAHRQLENYKLPASPAPLELEYVPVDDDPIIINPLLGELTDYIRGIVDERLDERGL